MNKPAFGKPYLSDLLDLQRETLVKAEAELAQVEETRANLIDAISKLKRQLSIASEISSVHAIDAQRRANAVGSVDSVIKVLEANRGRKMSAREIVDAAGTDLRVRYLVMRHVGKPKIHESGSTKGKVYWIDDKSI